MRIQMWAWFSNLPENHMLSANCFLYLEVRVGSSEDYEEFSEEEEEEIEVVGDEKKSFDEIKEMYIPENKPDKVADEVKKLPETKPEKSVNEVKNLQEDKPSKAVSEGKKISQFHNRTAPLYSTVNKKSQQTQNKWKNLVGSAAVCFGQFLVPFMLFVALRYYQQKMVAGDWVGDEAGPSCGQMSKGPLGHDGLAPSRVEAIKGS
ncbi:hypothetical protein V6N12_072205 [Hibiscus sabdariffa]|uniref:Uncharacterized protein n=2 Tax=Hibiscus sabdariffa TaxID=183260 RepID=A0ABR2FMQ5_9ROSI